LEPCLDQWYHVYHDNFYNSIRIAENLLERKVRGCTTINENGGLPANLKTECHSLKHGKSTFRHKGGILFQKWRDERLVRVISTLPDASIVEGVFKV
jgi:hypothetical protein